MSTSALGLLKTPTKTVYHWLVANPAKPGTLMTANTKVSVPTPEFEVKPPSVKEPAPVVKAVVKAPEPEGGQIWGPAVWVKVYETESEQPAELNHLLTDDPLVPQEPAQTETEWVLMQKEKGVANAAGDVASEKGLGGKHESVTRRYEIFKYTGPVDEEGEATPQKRSKPGTERNRRIRRGADGRGQRPRRGTRAGGRQAVRQEGPSGRRHHANDQRRELHRGQRGPLRLHRSEIVQSELLEARSPPESPAGTTGTVDVTVISPNGASALVTGDKFKYENPTVTGVSPSTGPKAGGTSVTVTGSGFALGAATSMKFGSKAAAGVECTDHDQLHRRPPRPPRRPRRST